MPWPQEGKDSYGSLRGQPSGYNSGHRWVNYIHWDRRGYGYTESIGIGTGLLASRDMFDDHIRDGSRPAIFLMTDGNASVSLYNFSLPSGWDWNEVADFDGDGQADFSTGSRSIQYAFYQTILAGDPGNVIMTVSSYAYEDLMEAIANLSGGVYSDVPEGGTLADFRESIQLAYAKITAQVPPARLLSSTEQ